MMGRTFGGKATTSSKRHFATPRLPLVTPILDPVFTDLSPQSRQYLFYYLHRCCVECTFYPNDSRNRFARFLALIPRNPVLVHSLIAVSATHQAQAGVCISPTSSLFATTGQPAPDFVNWDKLMRDNKLLLVQYSDALTHSTLGISALREGLASTDCSDALVAAVLLLIWVDVLESGKANWKLHLEGLSVLIALRRSLSKGSDTNVNSSSDFQNWFEETFTVLSIFGSTFSPQLLRLSKVLPRSELEGVLERAESHSWTGCPSDLMLILHTFNALSSDNVNPSSQDITQLFTRLRDFDCANWVVKVPQSSATRTRRSLVEAWKGSIEIYGRRALGWQVPDFEEVPSDLIEITLSHLEQIDRRDTHFKATIWPVFIVGAEARTVKQRQTVTNIIKHLIEYLRLTTLHAAFSQLERIWARPTPYQPGKSWIHDIWEREEGLLII
ncbi:hypothetical protein AAE478_000547 [Parahypoxylon ruwenzoriense]